MPEHKRKVGKRGQLTIPKELRERRGIEGGDEVVFVEVDDEIRIKPPTDEERLAEGYRKRAERSRNSPKKWKRRRRRQPSASVVLRSGASNV